MLVSGRVIEKETHNSMNFPEIEHELQINESTWLKKQGDQISSLSHSTSFLLLPSWWFQPI